MDIKKEVLAILDEVLSLNGRAASFELETVAEGVETNEQLEFLKEEKCNHVQGFLFSKPMPFTAMTNVFKAKTELVEANYIN